MNSNKILVTGAAGFIGYHVCKNLLEAGYSVVGIDNLNSYYDVNLKNARLKELEKCVSSNSSSWSFFKNDITNKESLIEIFNKFRPRIVINLAAQAGVRYSLKNPELYIESNIVGFTNILECCRNFQIKNFLYASSSSVYGGNTKVPFSEEDSTNHPVSLYAATKRSNELIAHSYSHLYGIPSTGLRFFTVYGPWGRPDMAPMIFVKSIINSEPIKVFNFGQMTRDFTYINDISEAIFKCTFKPASSDSEFDEYNPDSSTSTAPHRIFNVGNSKSVELNYFIELIEDRLKKKANKVFCSLPPGDVINTYADTSRLEKWIDFKPKTPIEDGIISFIDWYKNYYLNL